MEADKVKVVVAGRDSRYFMGVRLDPGRYNFRTSEGYCSITYGRGNLHQVRIKDMEEMAARGELSRTEDGTFVVN